MNGFEDIIFHQRNKDYGAYDMRRRYPRILVFSLGVSVAAFILLFVLSEISLTAIHDKITETEYVYNISDTSLTHITQRKANAPPAGGSLFIPVRVPDVVDSIPENDTIINSADGNGNDSTGRGNGNGTGNGIGTVFYSVQDPPMFSGGDAERINFLRRNVNIPPLARKNKIHGKVVVSFIVEKDGSISTVTLVSGIGYGCDEEALRVISSMPRWKPGRQNGTPVRVCIKWPLVF